jgi:hypothetical protein
MLRAVIARSDPQMPSFSRVPRDGWLSPHGGWRGYKRPEGGNGELSDISGLMADAFSVELVAIDLKHRADER